MVALAKAGPTQFQSLPMEPLQHPPSTTQRISCHGRLANLLLQRTVFISVSLNLALRPQKRMPAGIYKGHLQASIRTPQIVNQPNQSKSPYTDFFVKVRLSHYWLLGTDNQTWLTWRPGTKHQALAHTPSSQYELSQTATLAGFSFKRALCPTKQHCHMGG